MSETTPRGSHIEWGTGNGIRLWHDPEISGTA